MVVMMVMMMVVPLAKRCRSGNHGKEQDCCNNLFHRSHPSTASVTGRQTFLAGYPDWNAPGALFAEAA
jgi:hypothetical protein